MIEHRPNSRNRNYWADPMQGGGRSGYDYGRTPITPAKGGAWDLRSHGFAFFCIALAISGLLFSAAFQ